MQAAVAAESVTVNMKLEEHKRRGSFGRRKPKECLRPIVTLVVGVVFGFFIGVTFRTLLPSKLKINPPIDTYLADKNSGQSTQTILNVISATGGNISTDAQNVDPSKIWVSSNPRGAERLPLGIVVPESDLYPRRLFGKPSEDLKIKPKYLVAFTVGYDQKYNIDKAVKKFSENFTIVLFHYDGRTTEWNEFEWSQHAIHVSVPKQTKWWFAKRYLHPDIVAPYDYVFLWDEDLGVEHFNAEEYIKLVRKHKLEISQPGLDPRSNGLTWQMTKRRGDHEVHKEAVKKRDWCPNPHLPPCAGFVEIMAPVFSRDAWRCVWHMVPNDLVHGWGLDFAVQRCTEVPHENIGVVDAQWIVHQGVPSLGNQGQEQKGKKPWEGVRERCRKEWNMFQDRVSKAEKDYYKSIGVDPENLTAH